jgi:hypothetical protein
MSRVAEAARSPLATRVGESTPSQDCTLCHALLARDEKNPPIAELAAKARPR